ncbi:serine hydrolase domain-containing protein [Sphingomonas montana]|uniref:serine hydrolase domain-containing protein n=1 Tax=Sphingomonas montana TaxID=1843236 RepID=UPI001F0ACA7D|nr:serine hydrolase [Sphingomonas montana]
MPSWESRPVELFGGGEQTENFANMASIYPSRRIRRSTESRPLADGPPIELPLHVPGVDGIGNVAAFLEDGRSTGLLVLKNGKVRYEKYWHGFDRTTQHISFSVCKSFVATLVAFAVREGVINSLDDNVDHYVPTLRGSGYEGATIRQVLQMSSGVRWNEDYTTSESDVAKFNDALTKGGSFGAVCSGLPREHPPGTFNRYNSCDTHVLSMVVAGAAGIPLWDFTERMLWQPLGMEEDGYFLVDGLGTEAAAMGLNATLRDYAKLGLFYADRGCLDGHDLLPAGFWTGCATATEPHLRPGERLNATSPFGYGFQWWIPDDTGPFTAIGVYHQYIWIDPKSHVVVVKTSADPSFGQNELVSDKKDRQHFALFKAISRLLG